MEAFDPAILKKISLPAPDSHKGQNGKLMIIGGSHLFHAASLWALTAASRIVDMVFYSSVVENNAIVSQLKKEFRNGIVVRQQDIESYIEEAECILIGPGMMRAERGAIQKLHKEPESLEEIFAIADEGLQSHFLLKYLLHKYTHKKWVIDAGALQMMHPEWLKLIPGRCILTPHPKEFHMVFETKTTPIEKAIMETAKKYKAIIILKGEKDIITTPEKQIVISGGNAGMTKGGTGDVLAGLTAGLACQNDIEVAALAASYINKKAGDALFDKVGYFFNASDLANEIPYVMASLLRDVKAI